MTTLISDVALTGYPLILTYSIICRQQALQSHLWFKAMEGCACVLNNIVNILQEKDLLNKILKTEIKENSVIANLFVFVFNSY